MRKIATISLSGVPAALIAVVCLSTEVNAQATLAQRRSESGQVSKSPYADGTYTATGQYGSRPSFITVTVTLRNGIITDVLVRPHATVPTSLEFQRSFAAAVPKAVIGRPIDRLRLGKLARSSGTPRGFNPAIQKIKEQAKS